MRKSPQESDARVYVHSEQEWNRDNCLSEVFKYLSSSAVSRTEKILFVVWLSVAVLLLAAAIVYAASLIKAHIILWGMIIALISYILGMKHASILRSILALLEKGNRK